MTTVADVRPTARLATHRWARPRIKTLDIVSAVWLIVPAGILGLTLLIPISIGVREWLRWARASRRSRSSPGL